MNATKLAAPEPEVFFIRADPETAPQKHPWENHGNSCQVLKRNKKLLGRLSAETTKTRKKNRVIDLDSFQPNFTIANPQVAHPKLDTLS